MALLVIPWFSELLVIIRYLIRLLFDAQWILNVQYIRKCSDVSKHTSSLKL